MEQDTPKEISKKELILQAAEKLFSENGYEATSTRALAKEADVNLGMLTYYFGSKYNILEAIIDSRMDFYTSGLDEIKKQPITNMQKLEAMLILRINHMLSNIKYHKIVTNELLKDSQSKLHDYVIKHVKKHLESAGSIITKGIEENEFREVDAQLFLISIFGTINQYIKSEYLTLSITGQKIKNNSITSQHNKERLTAFLMDYLHTFLKK